MTQICCAQAAESVVLQPGEPPHTLVCMFYSCTSAVISARPVPSIPGSEHLRFMGSLKISFSTSSAITSLLNLERNICLAVRHKRPTLGGRGPGYRLSAAVEDGGWLHTVSRPQSPWFVCSGRSPQPPGHLHTTNHGHSQLSIPGGAAEGRDGPGGASGAVLGLQHVGKHSLAPRAATSGAATPAAEREEVASRTAVRCLLSTSKCSAWWSLRSTARMSTKGGWFLAQCTWLSRENCCSFSPFRWEKPSSVTLATVLAQSYIAHCTFCILFPSHLGDGLIKTLSGMLGFYLALLSVSLCVSAAVKSSWVRSPLTFPGQKIVQCSLVTHPFTMSAMKLFICQSNRLKCENGLDFSILYFKQQYDCYTCKSKVKQGQTIQLLSVTLPHPQTCT